jgi:hypothetical protein
MADKSSFSAEEWSKVRGSVLAAGLAVSMAEPSGLIGMLQEGFANAREFIAAKQDANANSLIKAVVADLESSEGRTAARAELQGLVQGKQPADAKAATLTALGEAGRILDSRAPQDAAVFKDWLNEIADKVANAASEGGFLGFGGTQVSEKERATLGEIRAALA